MAKTKKESQEQNSEEKQDGITAGLTDSELYPDGSPPAGMIDLEPVSYTHLDVYKRQIQMGALVG